jgi:hypothetical protein
MKIEQNYNLPKIQEFTEGKVDQNQKKETSTAKKDVFETIPERQPSIFDVRFPTRTSKQSEMADEIADEQKATYDESKKLFKLAIRVITEHEERKSQATGRL